MNSPLQIKIVGGVFLYFFIWKLVVNIVFIAQSYYDSKIPIGEINMHNLKFLEPRVDFFKKHSNQIEQKRWLDERINQKWELFNIILFCYIISIEKKIYWRKYERIF